MRRKAIRPSTPSWWLRPRPHAGSRLTSWPSAAVHERRAVLHVFRRIYWTGSSVVYALSEPHCSRSPATTPRTDLVACHAAKYSAGQRHIDVIGPLLETSSHAHRGFWHKDKV